MRSFSFWDEIPIPPREEEGVRLSLEDGRVAARFTLGDDDRIKPVSIRHPSLKPLARAVRPDGSVPAEKALAFLEQFESGGLSSGARVEIDSSVYLLTKIDAPSDVVLNFIFDGEDALTPLVESHNELFSYDGNGVFLSSGGDFFTLPASSAVDPYLNGRRKLPSGHFGIFFKLILPRLERETEVYCSLTLEKKCPVLFTPRMNGDICEVESRWEIPFDELSFLPGSQNFSEFSGSLYPSSRLLSSLPEPLRRDGVVRPDRLTLRILHNLFRELPMAFAAAPPSPLSAESAPPFAAAIPPREKAVGEARAFPGGEIRISPVRPVNYARSMALATFLRLYGDKKGFPCVPVPYNAFAPGWQDLAGAKLSTYLYARDAFLNGETPEVDYSYLLLLIYEAANRPDRLDMLFLIWKSGRERFRRLDTMMPALMRDYIALYHPELPFPLIRERVPFDPALLPHPELYLSFEGEKAVSELPRSLYARISGYDFAKSRFLTGAPERRDALLGAFSRALVAADRWSRDREGVGFFARFKPPVVSFRVMACSPAPMLTAHSSELQYKYAAYLESAGLKEFTAELFKAAENVLREKAGMRGRLRSSLPEGLLPAIRGALEEKKRPAPLSLDLEKAVALEKDSWINTDRLIAAAGVSPEDEPLPESPAREEETANSPLSPKPFPGAEGPAAGGTGAPQDDGDAFFSALGEDEKEFLRLLLKGAGEAEKSAFAAARFTMPDLLIESINDKALNATGDVLIENGEIIPDYRPLLEAFPEII
ncbi:MAG: hypothetical protein IJM21_06235 [Clostridia bacterium]|nr:hypothetical protein [Clostridia bacterium]